MQRLSSRLDANEARIARLAGAPDSQGGKPQFGILWLEVFCSTWVEDLDRLEDMGHDCLVLGQSCPKLPSGATKSVHLPTQANLACIVRVARVHQRQRVRTV